jgi:hypothetical protein
MIGVQQKNQFPAFAGGVENQYNCPLGGVYNQKLDKCRSFFEEPTPTSISPVLQNNMERDIKVLNLFIIKKGDTCIKVTGYSLQECLELAYDNGRAPLLFIDSNGKQTLDVPLYVGEQIAFVLFNKGNELRLRYILEKRK